MLGRDTRGTEEEERGGGTSGGRRGCVRVGSLRLVIRGQQVEPLQSIATRWTAGDHKCPAGAALKSGR
ncbi:hypothetical protein EYF80_042085 [Liparis tanakae]|uniref:Uncharacterized protein n=1 Tax=Liparis tanakae TaxID=230148 RepID=A0A4Z2G2B5_9TELE|nr:hypothetical protein EYF80_042085 [Liparis tanakae]